jgi:hypothetical protein
MNSFIEQNTFATVCPFVSFFQTRGLPFRCGPSRPLTDYRRCGSAYSIEELFGLCNAYRVELAIHKSALVFAGLIISIGRRLLFVFPRPTVGKNAGV